MRRRGGGNQILELNVVLPPSSCHCTRTAGCASATMPKAPKASVSKSSGAGLLTSSKYGRWPSSSVFGSVGRKSRNGGRKQPWPLTAPGQ